MFTARCAEITAATTRLPHQHRQQQYSSASARASGQRGQRRLANDPVEHGRRTRRGDRGKVWVKLSGLNINQRASERAGEDERGESTRAGREKEREREETGGKREKKRHIEQSSGVVNVENRCVTCTLACVCARRGTSSRVFN